MNMPHGSVYLKKLKSILRVPQTVYSTGDSFSWARTEKEHGISFPAEYKEFISTYGTGSIDDFIWILTPFENESSINIFSRAEIMRDSYNYLKKSSPDDFKYSIYPDEKGLLVWGYTDNGDELYFNLESESVIIMPSRCRDSDVLEYKMGMIEFFCKLFTNEIECCVFPDDLVIGGFANYSSIKLR